MDNDKEKSTVDGGTSSRETKQGRLTSSTPYLTIDQIEKQDFSPRRIPYDVKDTIKNAVPVQYRVWDDSDKTWWIHRDYLAEVDKLVHRHTGKDELTGLRWNTAWTTLYLYTNAPRNVIDAVRDTLLASAESEAQRTRILTAFKIVTEW